MNGGNVMNMKYAVEQSAIAQACPDNKIEDVWEVVRTMELPQSQKHLDNDVFYAMRELGLAR